MPLILATPGPYGHVDVMDQRGLLVNIGRNAGCQVQNTGEKSVRAKR